MTNNTPGLNNLLDVDREINEAENLQETLQAKIDAFAVQTGVGVVKEQLIYLKQIKEECIKQAAPILFSKEKNYLVEEIDYIAVLASLISVYLDSLPSDT